MSRKVVLLLCVCLTLWSSAFIGIRVALVDFSPGALALLRMLITSIALFIYYCFDNNVGRHLTKKDFMWCFFIGAALAYYFAGLNYGEKTVAPALASFVVSTEPIMISLIAALFLKEKLTIFNYVGLIVSFMGVLVIFNSDHKAMSHFDWGIIIILLATFSCTFYVVFQKPLLERLTSKQILPWYIWSATLVLSPFSNQLIHNLQHTSLHSLVVVLYLGICPTLIALSIWTYAVSKVPVNQAVSGLYAIPFIAILLEWLILNTTINIEAFLGGCVALFGAVIINLPSLKQAFRLKTISNQ